MSRYDGYRRGGAHADGSRGQSPTGSGHSPGRRTLVEEVYGVQTKRHAAVGPATDAHEQEADRVASTVVARLGGDATPAEPPAVTPVSASALQRKETDGGAATEGVDRALGSSGGAPLDGPLQHKMGAAFGGRDFGAVRVHTDGAAAQSAVDIGARAYTRGQDIYFAQGQYQPSTTEGQHLLAHELVHTLQQGASSGPVQRKPEGTPDFKTLLSKGKTKEAVATWDALEDKTSVDEDTIVLAIQKLDAAVAHRILLESGTGFTTKIVAAIVKSKKNWHDELESQAEEIASLPESDPRAGLLPVVKAKKAPSGYKGPTKLSAKPPAGTILAIGEPYELEVCDVPGWVLAEKAAAGAKGAKGETIEVPTYRWRIVADETVFGTGPIEPRPDSKNAATVRFALTPRQAGKTTVEVEVIALCSDGLLGKTSAPYTLDVMDTARGSEDFFEARFAECFRETLDAEPFATMPRTDVDGKPLKNVYAALFTQEQRDLILDYTFTKIVPPGLFTEVAENKATGPQRVLIASNMLTNGRIDLDGGETLDGARWAASCCGGWANGVYAYAGVNFGRGYGNNSSEQSIAPTGEKSYGSVSQGKATDVDEKGKTKSMQTPEDVKALKEEKKALLAPLEAAKKKKRKAKKGSTAEAEAQAEVDAAQKEVDEKLPGINAELRPAQIAHGSSPFGSGHLNMQVSYFTQQMKPGDWVYIDNNGAAGHSVIFAGWADKPLPKPKTPSEPELPPAMLAQPTIHTEKELETKAAIAQAEKDRGPLKPEAIEAITLQTAPPRDVTYVQVYVYNQRSTDAGGTFDKIKLGFPQSSALGVSGVYAITHAIEDANPADSPDELLHYDRAAAIKSNRKILFDKKHDLDLGKVKDKLHGIVEKMVAGLAGDVRSHDTKGKVEGAFTKLQYENAVLPILAGSGDLERDIADLVALGQKAGAMSVVPGDPGQPDGKLDTKRKLGTWSAPWPAWKSDTSLKTAAETAGEQ